MPSWLLSLVSSQQCGGILGAFLLQTLVLACALTLVENSFAMLYMFMRSRVQVLTLVFPLQYGMLLYQNYRIPQQRKALLSPFNTPMVSRGPSTVKYCGNLIAACLTYSKKVSAATWSSPGAIFVIFGSCSFKSWAPWMQKSLPGEDIENIYSLLPKSTEMRYITSSILKIPVPGREQASQVIEECSVCFPELMPPSMVCGEELGTDHPVSLPSLLAFFLNQVQSPVCHF